MVLWAEMQREPGRRKEAPERGRMAESIGVIKYHQYSLPDPLLLQDSWGSLTTYPTLPAPAPPLSMHPDTEAWQDTAPTSTLSLLQSQHGGEGVVPASPLSPAVIQPMARSECLSVSWENAPLIGCWRYCSTLCSQLQQEGESRNITFPDIPRKLWPMGQELAPLLNKWHGMVPYSLHTNYITGFTWTNQD